MPFNGSGVFTPSEPDVQPGTVILASVFNNDINDIATGLGSTVTRDGQGKMSAPFTIVNGSQSAPGLAFTAETATGLYRPSTGILGLSVQGAVNTTFTSSNTTFALPVIFSGTSTFNAAPSWASDPSTADHLTRKSYVDTAITAAAYVKKIGDNMSGPLIITTTTSGVQVLSGAAGNYGSISIGRTSSESIIAVAGGSNQVLNGDTAGDLVLRNNSGRLLFGLASGALAMTLDTGGRLGVGMVPATRRLSLGGSAVVDMTLKSNVASGGSGSSTVYFGNSATDTAGFIDYSHASNNMAIGTNGSTRIAVTQFGDVGIGGIPSFALDVVTPAANIRIAPSITTSNALVRMTNGGGTTFIGRDTSTGALTGTGYATAIFTDTAAPIIVSTNNAEAFRVDSVQRLSIGTTSTNGPRLSVVGGALFSGAAGIGFASNLTAGRLASGDSLNNTAYIGQYSDSTVTELSVGTSSGYVSGVVLAARSAVVNPGSVGLYTHSALRLTVDSVGRLSGTALHNNAAGLAGTTQYIGSGTYTPTLSNVSGISGASAGASTYIRVGNVVSVEGYLTGNIAAGAVTFHVSYPIATSQTSAPGGGGIGGQAPVAAGQTPFVGSPNVSGAFQFTGVATANASGSIFFKFQYVVT